MIDLLTPTATDIALDLGTGKGNTAFILEPFVKRFLAVNIDEVVVLSLL
jgi:protein-L-isoaspartate O-methyltransferase